MAKKALPWRFQTDDRTGFDELVVGMGGRPCLLHAEMMTERAIFVTIGELAVWAHVGKDGVARVTGAEWRPGKMSETVTVKLPSETPHKGVDRG